MGRCLLSDDSFRSELILPDIDEVNFPGSGFRVFSTFLTVRDALHKAESLVPGTSSWSVWSGTVASGLRNLVGDRSRCGSTRPEGVRAQSADLLEASSGSPGRLPNASRPCSALANPHGVTHHPEIRRGEQGRQLRRVLRQSPVPHLHVPELALHHPERMLHPGPHLRLHPFRQRHRRSRHEQSALPRSHRDVPRRLRCNPPVHRPLGARIRVDVRLPSVQQVTGHGDVVRVRRAPPPPCPCAPAPTPRPSRRAPSSRRSTGSPSSSGASPDPASPSGSQSSWQHGQWWHRPPFPT